MSVRLSRGGPSSARFVRRARSLSLPVSGWVRSTKPRSACGKTSSRPSSSRGRTSPSESDAPMARLSPSTARSFAAACWPGSSSAEGRGMAICDTITASESSSAGSSPSKLESIRNAADECPPAASASNRSRCPQIEMTSPLSSPRFVVSRTSLIVVPLRLRRSSIVIPAAVTSRAACCRLTDAASRTMSQSGWRPMRIRPGSSTSRSPLRVPVWNSRTATGKGTLSGWSPAPGRSETALGPGRNCRRPVGWVRSYQTPENSDFIGPLGNGVTVARLALNQLV